MYEIELTQTRTAFKNIAVKQDTYETLKSLGKMSDSYDSVIKRLLERRNE